MQPGVATWLLLLPARRLHRRLKHACAEILEWAMNLESGTGAARLGAGRVLIVAVKGAAFEQETVDDEMCLAGGEQPRSRGRRQGLSSRRLERLNPHRLKYHVLFARCPRAYDDPRRPRPSSAVRARA